MNLYLRYFNDEVLVENLDQAYDFLRQLPDINVDDNLMNDLAAFMDGKSTYPKRYKVTPYSYFIAIKTLAKTLEEFKEHSERKGKGSDGNKSDGVNGSHSNGYSAFAPGWYQASIVIKKVTPIEDAPNKFQYVDTEFVAKLKAHSIQECYDLMLSHLRSRSDVDPRSQYPSIRGRNFKAEFLGMD